MEKTIKQRIALLDTRDIKTAKDFNRVFDLCDAISGENAIDRMRYLQAMGRALGLEPAYMLWLYEFMLTKAKRWAEY